MKKINTDNHRELNDQIKDIMMDFADKYLDKDEFVDNPLTIKSAIALSDEQVNRIVQAVSAARDKQFTEVQRIVDPSLLFGVRVYDDSFYYELSGSKQLNELATVLKSPRG